MEFNWAFKGLNLLRTEKLEVRFKDNIKIYINPLKTNDIPLYLKAQFVPRCKHFSSRL